MNPYLKGVHLTLDSWTPHRDRDGWKLRKCGGSLKIAEIESKWDGVEESDKPYLLKVVPWLGKKLDALERLTDAVNPTWR